MNEEIKEILDYLAFTNDDIMWCDKITLDIKKSHLLLDYITNLQQENERLKEENNNKAMNDYAHAIDESWYRELYEDYKSRIDKARKMIFDNYGLLDKYGIEMLDDILKGDSDV